MYNTSAAFVAAAQAKTRKILTRAIFNNETELTGQNIISMSVTEAVNASGGISMGATISSKLEMTIKTPEQPLSLDGSFVVPAVSFEGESKGFNLEDDGTLMGTATLTANGTLVYEPIAMTDSGGVLVGSARIALEYCPLGKFYISEAKSDNNFANTFKIVAYDGFSKTEETYSPTITMPNTAEAILADIAMQCGFSISPDIEYPAGEFGLYDFTCRQYIGYFAGLLGKNARFDRDGYLTFTWYQSRGYIIESDQQYLGGLKKLTEALFTVQSISSGTSDKLLVSGDGVGISFENPFITQDQLDAIASRLGVFSYMPSQLKWRGNPAIEAGDIVFVQTNDNVYSPVYVMEQTLRISGGMHSEIKCYGQSESDIKFSTSPTQKKLQQVYTTLQQAIKEATSLLQGANGGVFELLDEDKNGINDGWIIHSVDGQKFIKANVNGIGITTDGGATFTEALTPEGLNASAVTTGQLNAQRVSIGDAVLGDVLSVAQDADGHIVVTIGASDSDIVQKQTNDAIVFEQNGSLVAKFSTTGAEWDKLQQMKYCGFLWTKSATSGNVRFTKVEE